MERRRFLGLAGALLGGSLLMTACQGQPSPPPPPPPPPPNPRAKPRPGSPGSSSVSKRQEIKRKLDEETRKTKDFYREIESGLEPHRDESKVMETMAL